MERTYENQHIRVFWDSSLCIHTGRCLKAEGEVFDVERRPWVMLEGGTTEQAVAAIESCPSGALRYERVDGGPAEQPANPPTVVPWPNGPLFVRGNVEIQDARGELMDAGPRFSLCRCGASKNHPFCDLSHKEIGFKNYPRVASEKRAEAQAPDEVSSEEMT